MFKSRPGFDEGIFESYVHLNIVVPELAHRRWSGTLSYTPPVQTPKIIRPGKRENRGG